MPPPSASTPVLLTVADVAKTLTIGTRTVYRLIEAGHLHAIRVAPRALRIHPNDLATFLTQPVRAA